MDSHAGAIDAEADILHQPAAHSPGAEEARSKQGQHAVHLASGGLLPASTSNENTPLLSRDAPRRSSEGSNGQPQEERNDQSTWHGMDDFEDTPRWRKPHV